MAPEQPKTLYPLRDFAVRHLILKNSSDPYTWGLSSGATGKVLLQMHREPQKPCAWLRAFGWVGIWRQN